MFALLLGFLGLERTEWLPHRVDEQGAVQSANIEFITYRFVHQSKKKKKE
jgi:hypothetical protein